MSGKLLTIHSRERAISVMEGISTLPEEILQQILSLLDVREATRTCVLSKAWLSAWQTRPRLQFFEYEFSVKNRLSKNVCRDKFVNYVSTTLLRYRERKIGIQCFKLSLRDDCEDCDLVSLLDNWIQVAVECGVKKLELCCDSYILPQFVFEPKSLEDLCVNYFWPNLRLQVPEKISCFRLKRLQLYMACLDEGMLQNIISSCHLIEYMSLHKIEGIENLKVVRCLNLKQLIISHCNCQSIEVEAPNLESFSCESDWYVSYDQCRLNLRASQNLKFLKLISIGITDMFSYINYEFPKLEDLIIHGCNGLRYLKILGQSLRKLDLTYNDGLEGLWIDCPNIVQFDFSGGVIPSVSFTNSSRCWDSDIGLETISDIVDFSWFCKLKEFLKNLIPSKISLDIDFSFATGFNFEEMAKSLAFPEPNVHKLSLHFSNNYLPSSYFSTIIDGIFWTCRPTLITMDLYLTSDIEIFMKFFYQKLMVERNQDYYSSQEIKSWEQDLKVVKVEFFERVGHKYNKLDSSDWDTCVNMATFDELFICYGLGWGRTS